VASDINTVTLTGRVVADPETRNGGKVAAFGVAINRSVRQDDGSWADAVDFVDVSTFNGVASLVLQKLRKADKVVLHGRLSQSTWEVEGQKRSKLGVIANQVIGEFAYRAKGASWSPTPDPETASEGKSMEATGASAA
jgi:single-strand DNA-binding protein